MRLKKSLVILFFSPLISLFGQSGTVNVVTGTESITWETTPSLFGVNRVSNLTSFKGELYFAGDHSTLGPGLFKVDATDNVVHVADIHPGLTETEGYPTELSALANERAKKKYYK